MNISKKFLSSLLLAALSLGYVGSAYAAFISNFSDTMSRLSVSTLSSHTLKFTTPSGASGNNQTIIVTFPTTFNFTNKSTTTITFTHGPTTGLETTETLAGAQTATAWGVALSGTASTTLTLTAPTDGVGAAAVAANDKLIITLSSASSTNPAATGTYQIGVTGTFGDVGTTTVAVIPNDTVNITAQVAQTLSFSISTSTVFFGSLSTGAAKFASSTNVAGDTVENVAHTVAVATNAGFGYTLTLNGPTLTSQQNASNTISEIGSTAASSTAGTEQFGLRATKAGGTGATISALYAQASSYGYNATSSAQVLSTGTGATATETYSLRYVANIAALTEAGNYATNIIYVATANF